ncbi:MAG: S9 family peptidase [Bacillota bacterium]
MQKRPLQPADFLALKLPGEAQFSPDGQSIVYAVQELSKEKDQAFISLWLYRNGETIRLTSGKHRDRQPRWSPDGRRLAFLSDRSGKSQMWIMEVGGGEPWPLTTKLPVESAPRWSPDGRQIAFCAKVFVPSDDWLPYPGAPTSDRQRALAQAEKVIKGKDEKNGDDKTPDVKVITRLRHRLDGVGFFGDCRSQVFVVEVPDSPPDEAVEPRQLTRGDHDHSDPAWSPDGRWLVCSSNHSPEADWESKSDLWLIEAATAEVHLLLTNRGYASGPTWSPDGHYIAYGGDDRSHGGSTTPGLWVVPVEGYPHQPDAARCLTREMDRPLGCGITSDVRYATSTSPYAWTPDSRSLYFIYGDHGAAYLGRVGVSGGMVERVAGDPMATISAFDLTASGDLVLQMGDMVTPDELYLMPAGGAPERLTHCNDQTLASWALGRPGRFTYAGADGWEIDAFVLYPAGYQPGTRVPTVLFIHGGPHGVYGTSFMFQSQIMASNGLAVIYTNPRGSQSYGQEFAYAVVGDWGGKDFEDIMRGVDAFIEKGVADPGRLGVTGWSYGGYMTSWTVTQTDRFKAAIAGAIVYNRHNFWGTSDIGHFFGEHHFGGNPWQDAEKLLSRSAVKYVDRVKTPVMIVHGENDLRCPIEQADQFFYALRKMKKEAVYIRYPGEFHGINKPSHREDRYGRYLSWFQHYLTN